MYVCLCNAVTERTIREAADRGVRTVKELRLHTGCASVCGTCEDLAEEVLADALESGAGADRVYLKTSAA